MRTQRAQHPRRCAPPRAPSFALAMAFASVGLVRSQRRRSIAAPGVRATAATNPSKSSPALGVARRSGECARHRVRMTSTFGERRLREPRCRERGQRSARLDDGPATVVPVRNGRRRLRHRGDPPTELVPSGPAPRLCAGLRRSWTGYEHTQLSREARMNVSPDFTTRSNTKETFVPLSQPPLPRP